MKNRGREFCLLEEERARLKKVTKPCFKTIIQEKVFLIFPPPAFFKQSI